MSAPAYQSPESRPLPALWRDAAKSTTWSQMVQITRVYRKEIFDVERAAVGRPPDERQRMRQINARPIIDDLISFFDAACGSSPARASWPPRSGMHDRDGRRSPAITTIAAWRPATTPPSAPSSRWL